VAVLVSREENLWTRLLALCSLATVLQQARADLVMAVTVTDVVLVLMLVLVLVWW
jgi:hypothetical protein